MALISGTQKAFDYAEFDLGGHCAAAKIYYFSRIELLKERIKKGEPMSASLMGEMSKLITDLLSHRHLYSQDVAYGTFGNRGGDPVIYYNKLSGYPANLNNQVLLTTPYIAGSTSERWFSSCTDFLNPEILEASAVLRTHRMKTQNHFEYLGNSTNPIPSEMGSTNFGLIVDFCFNFTNADLGTTKYFYINHDDSVNIIFNGLLVYRGRANSRPAFYITVTSDLINKPLPCQIIWCQGQGAYKLQLRMANSFGYNLSDYSLIPSSYISSLTPINEWGDAKNVSFYTFIQQLSMLFNHNHHYTDAGYTSGNATYSSLMASFAASVANGTAFVSVNTTTGIANTSDIDTQLIDGSGYVRVTHPYTQHSWHYFWSQATNLEYYIDITISPFTVNL